MNVTRSIPLLLLRRCLRVAQRFAEQRTDAAPPVALHYGFNKFWYAKCTSSSFDHCTLPSFGAWLRSANVAKHVGLWLQ